MCGAADAAQAPTAARAAHTSHANTCSTHTSQPDEVRKSICGTEGSRSPGVRSNWSMKYEMVEKRMACAVPSTQSVEVPTSNGNIATASPTRQAVAEIASRGATRLACLAGAHLLPYKPSPSRLLTPYRACAAPTKHPQLPLNPAPQTGQLPAALGGARLHKVVRDLHHALLNHPDLSIRDLHEKPYTKAPSSPGRRAPAQGCTGSPPCTAPARRAGCCTCLCAATGLS